MGLRTGEEYRKKLGKANRKVYLHGRRVKNLVKHPVTRSVVDAMARMFDAAAESEHDETLNATSRLTGEKVSRNLYVPGSVEDLERRARMARLTSQLTGTCNYRCVGCDAIAALYATTWEMDQALGTAYHARFTEYLKTAQHLDLAVSGALTDPKGDRSRRPTDQAHPDLYLRVAEKRSDGIVLQGAKIHQSGAIAADETLVIPGLRLRSGEDAYAVACAVDGNSPGLIFISQYTPFSAERAEAESIEELGNPRYGVRETCMMVFDHVFVPWERVFMFGEIEFTGRLVGRFARMHRMSCGGACKVGYADLILGAAHLLAEYAGILNAPHIVEKLTEMVRIHKTSEACAIAAATRGQEDPPGAGVFFPDHAFGNIAKLNTAEGFCELIKLAADIAGGLVVTMPSERDLANAETGPYLEKYLAGAAGTAAARMRMTKFLQNWVAGLHGPGTWHGAGPPQTQRMSVFAATEWGRMRELAARLAGLGGSRNHGRT